MKIVNTKTSDGFHFNGLLSEAPNSKKIIIHIHGMAGNTIINEFYEPMHERYPKSGITFLVGEQRGTGVVTDFIHDGEDVTVGNAFEKFEECVFDIQGWVDFARSRGYEEVWLQSHSLGTSKVAYYLTETKNSGISGCVLISPADMVGLVHEPEGKKDHDLLLPEAKRLVSEGKGNNFLSHKLWGYSQLSANTYLNFFEDGSKLAIFNYYDDSLGWNVVNEIYVPVLAITGSNDDAVATVMEPHKAMEKLKQELKKSPRAETKVYEGAAHSFDGFGEQIVEDVIRFINT